MQPTSASSSHWYARDEIDRGTEVEESMLFVINEDGATKIVKRRYWGRFIRRMSRLGDEGSRGSDVSASR